MAEVPPSGVFGTDDTIDFTIWKQDRWPKDFSVSDQSDSITKHSQLAGLTHPNNPIASPSTNDPEPIRSINEPSPKGSRTLVAGVKRRAERSPDNDLSSSMGGASSLATKRRRTGLYQGFHGARKLVTSLFSRRQPETEVETSHWHETTTKEIASISKFHSQNRLSTGVGSDVNGLTNLLVSMNVQDIQTNQNSRLLSNGRKQFNMDPKKGMEYLIEQSLVENTPHDVAAFMYTAQGLSKTAIGQYLGERNAFNQEALKSFVNLHEFSQTNLVQALRQFLWSFRLPGEAQKIDRMMEQFADRYCQLNPGVFSSTDACYVLSFALIMLNTSLHNPNVRDKLTPEVFIAMNRGLQADQELSHDLLMVSGRP